jgi:hypothetical protein
MIRLRVTHNMSLNIVRRKKEKVLKQKKERIIFNIFYIELEIFYKAVVNKLNFLYTNIVMIIFEIDELFNLFVRKIVDFVILAPSIGQIEKSQISNVI